MLMIIIGYNYLVPNAETSTIYNLPSHFISTFLYTCFVTKALFQKLKYTTKVEQEASTQLFLFYILQNKRKFHI